MRRLSTAAALALALALAPFALARVGGGHSYSGGHSSSGGSHSSSSHSSSGGWSGGSSSGWSSSRSSGGSTGDFSQFMFAVFVLVAVVVVQQAIRRRGSTGWSTQSDGESTYQPPPPPARPPRVELMRLTHVGREPKGPPFDASFSLVLFEDFLYALYAKAQEARGEGKVAMLAAYLNANAREALAHQGQPAAVKAVIVGAMALEQVSPVEPAASRVVVSVGFEANFTEVFPDGREQGYYASERWTLERSTGVQTRPPLEGPRVFKCPNCGAPLDSQQGSTCSFCGKAVDTGDFDWVVTAIAVRAKEPRPPQLTSSAVEEGTDAPTRFQTNVQVRFAELRGDDPEVSWQAFCRRVEFVFQATQGAWAERDWLKARPFVTDNLFQMLLYWIDAYRKAGLRNVNAGGHITRTELARVTRDAFFDALTVRVYATGCDYTEDAHGHVLSGSKTKQRPFSEYWTFIRSAKARGAPESLPKCPSCGAELKIEMSGACAFCKAKVTSGHFDWVLSRIEQDEDYQ